MHPLPYDGFELMNYEEVKTIIFKDLNAALNLSIEQFQAKNYIETEKVHKLLNHPVHIIDKEGNLSPSALIPFCEFAGNMSTMGVEIEHFDVPVCNSFQAKVLNDQLCYEVDPNLYIDRNDPKKDLKLGLVLALDFNEDRQTAEGGEVELEENIEDGMIDQKTNGKQHATIYINSLGK